MRELSTDKPTKKTLEKKSYSLSDFKKSKGLSDNVKDKELEWIKLSPAFQEATGLPGVAKGYVVLSRGHSDTGKTTSLMEAFASAQKKGILPVWIDTENNFNWNHAREMGIEYDEIVDEDTGEVVNYDGFFIYVNNDYLINEYGKKIDKNRDEATIENVSVFCHELLDRQGKGELPYDIIFLWDSVGTIDCEKAVMSDKGNNQWNAGALESSFKSLLNSRIPGSRKEGKPYTNTFLAVQKIWIDNMGMGVVKHKGGEAFKYAARLIFHFGGTLAAGSKRLTATIKGRSYAWGTLTKLKCIKNHITGVELEGEIISTPQGYIGADKESIANYTKMNREYLISKMEVDDDGSEILIDEKEIEDEN